MKKHLLLFALFIALLAASATAAHAAPPVMKDFTEKEYLMSFSMPGDPVASGTTVTIPSGPVIAENYALVKGNAGLLAYVNVYTPQALTDPTATVISGARDTFLKGLGATASGQKEITLDGNPGIEFEFSGGGRHGICRFYKADNRLYQVTAVAASGSPLMDGTKLFLASFHILKQ